MDITKLKGNLEEFWKQREKEIEEERQRKSIPKQWTELELEEMIEQMIDERMSKLRIRED